MELRRFFVDASDIQGDEVTVSGDEFLHMTKVLRLKAGFQAIVCANDGTERLCKIREINRDNAVLNIVESKVVDRKNKSLTLYAGLLKNNKLDFTIQKCVELGVDRIFPFVSANSAETKFNADRARKIAVEAAKQCGSAYISEIGGLIDFEEVIKQIGDYDSVLFAYEFEKRNRIKDVDFKGDKIALIVGSEGGFKTEESTAAKNAGANIVTLGKRILRAETAGIVACALTLDALGELDYD